MEQAGQHFVYGRNNANLAALLVMLPEIGHQEALLLQTREGVSDATEREAAKMKWPEGRHHFQLVVNARHIQFGYFLRLPRTKNVHCGAVQKSDNTSRE